MVDMHEPPHPPRDDDSVSPSLLRSDAPGSAAAYELKFVLTEAQAADLESRLSSELLPDPHGDPALGGMYVIRSLAFDTADFGVFFREGRMRDRKYRIRCYGASERIYLERKRSKGGKVSKRRVEGHLDDLVALAQGNAPNAAQSWFVRGLAEHELAPVCLIEYHRRAFFGSSEGRPVRVTFDRQIRAAVSRGWSLVASGSTKRLMESFVICEFKFQGTMPAMMRRHMMEMNISPTGVSKYRTAVRAFAAELGVDLSKAPVPAHVAEGSRRA